MEQNLKIEFDLRYLRPVLYLLYVPKISLAFDKFGPLVTLVS